MDEQEVKRKIQLLYSVKPREEWVVSTRQKLVGADSPSAHLALQKARFRGMVEGILEMIGTYLQKPAFVMPVLAFLVAGGAVWQGAAASLPGDTLYPLKAAAEQMPLHFSANEERHVHEFQLAQQRLADLKAIARQNNIRNLPSAIQEFEENASKVSKGFVHIVENEPEKALQASRQVVELQKEKSEVERILGTKIGEEQEEEVENAMKRLVDYELAYLETRALTEEQEQLFEEAKHEVEEGNYADALEMIWTLSQDP